MSAPIAFDFNYMMASVAEKTRTEVARRLEEAMPGLGSAKEKERAERSVGALRHPGPEELGRLFLREDELEALRPRLKAAFEAIRQNRGNADKMLAWTELPYTQDDVVAQIEQAARRVRGRFDAFVVLGIGGSALGPMAVQQALGDLRHNELPREKRKAPRIYVEDNVDPERMASLLRLLDLDATCFNVISKSGNTSETMSQYLIVSHLLKEAYGASYAEHMILTTDEKKGCLREIAEKDGLVSFAVPDGVGGRFSELSPVGLLAAAVAGADIRAMLKGAAEMDARCASEERNPALFAAACQYLAMQKGRNVSVMMPYADSLKFFAHWYCQLWAESLGKNVLRDGSPAKVGQTPVPALGVTDQHSVVQLFMEGPDDKVVTFLRVGRYRDSVTVPCCEGLPADVAFLGGHTLGELIQTEQFATEYALLKAAKPSCSITLSEVDENALGQLMMFFELQTAYMGELLDIDAFNQPGVEEGKNATYGMFGRDQYADKKAEIDAVPPREMRYQF